MGVPGFTSRCASVALVALGSLLHYGAARLLLPEQRDERALRAAVAGLQGKVLRRAFERLGATFIKLGQVMSTRPDLFEPTMIAELRKLQDELPPFVGAREVVERELGAPLAESFAQFDDEPVAAASVAQVHRALLHDGSEVAVKVLRPDVRARAERDGAILALGAGLLERLSVRAAHAQLGAHVASFMQGIVAQTDLRIEAANSERFRENFRRVKKVRFPKVHPELSGERVLTMEFVRGRKVDSIPRDELPRGTAARLRDIYLQMCFDDGFIHADLHPGNFVVCDDGTVAIFDTGLVKQLDDRLLEHYIDFNRCLVMGEAADFIHHIRTYHLYLEGGVDWAELERDVARFAAVFRGMSSKDLEIGVLIDEIFDVGRKHGVRPQPELTLLMVGLVTSEGIGKQLDPDSNTFQEVANYLIPVLARRNMLSPSMMQAAAALSARMLRADDAASSSEHAAHV